MGLWEGGRPNKARGRAAAVVGLVLTEAAVPARGAAVVVGSSCLVPRRPRDFLKILTVVAGARVEAAARETTEGAAVGGDGGRGGGGEQRGDRRSRGAETR